MKNGLEPIKNSLITEKVTISSLEKLDNNYIRIIGNGYLKKDIDVITNGILTFDFSFYDNVKGIINFNECDYLIAEKDFREFLISLNDGKKIITKVKGIDYVGDGLFGISENETLMHSRKCRIKINKFGLLEIDDYQTDKKVLFDMNSGEFIQLEINVPIIETPNGRELDFSRLPIQEFSSNNQFSLLQGDSHTVKKLLLKPKTNFNS